MLIGFLLVFFNVDLLSLVIACVRIISFLVPFILVLYFLSLLILIILLSLSLKKI